MHKLPFWSFPSVYDLLFRFIITPRFIKAPSFRGQRKWPQVGSKSIGQNQFKVRIWKIKNRVPLFSHNKFYPSMNRNLSGQSTEKNVLAQTNERTCLLRSQKTKNCVWSYHLGSICPNFGFLFNPNKRGIGEKSPTFVQNDFTPWCLKLNIFKKSEMGHKLYDQSFLI